MTQILRNIVIQNIIIRSIIIRSIIIRSIVARSINSTCFLLVLLWTIFFLQGQENTVLAQGTSVLNKYIQDIWQPEYAFEHLSQEQGLSYNTVTSFTQDKHGFLWIATFNGLNRYDGVTFKIFPQKKANDTVSALLPREIRIIYADKHGDIWIAGFDNSIGRFHPQTETYSVLFLPTKGVAKDFVNAIKEDAAGTLWMTTVKGLFYLHPQQQEFVPVQTSDGKLFLPFSLGGIAEFPALNENVIPQGKDTSLHPGNSQNSSKEKRLWIRKHGGLVEFDPIRKTVRHYNFVDSSKDRQFFYGSVVRDSSGYLWCSDIEGLYCFDTRTKTVLVRIPREIYARASFIKNPLQNDFMTRSILCAPDGSLWFASNGGITVVRYRHSPQQYWFELLQNDEANPASLSGNTVRTLFVDKSGVVWAGGEPFGINKFTPYRQKFLLFRQLPFNSNSLSNNYVRGICLTRHNVLWVGTQFGGISRYEPEKRLWTRFRKVIGKKPYDAQATINETWSIFEDRFGTVWAGTRGNGLLRYDEALGGFVQSPLLPKDALIQIIREDSEGNLLLGIRGNTSLVGVFMIPPHRKKEDVVFIPTKQANGKNIFSGDVQAIHEDRRGVLWIGGTAEIMYLNRKTGIFEDKTSKFMQDIGGEFSHVGSTVVCITEDRNGTVWFSSKGLGLVRYDPSRDKFIATTEQQGLPNNSVYAMLEDKSGNFWISSDAGLTCWNRTNGTFRTFTTADGLQGQEYNRLSYWKGNNGMMFFGGTNGLNAFHPEHLLLNPTPPTVALTSIKIFAEEKAPGSIITTSESGSPTMFLNYDQNFLTFQFAAMDFHVPENNQYAYKLEGVDKNWVYNKTNREAVYTNLDPGGYMLLLRVANHDGIWNNNALKLRVVILPPWWQTWWFRAILIISGVGALVLVIQNYRRRIMRLQEHKQELLLHIDERKRAELDLQQSEEKFRALFETSTLGMVLWQNDGTILETNAAFTRFIGYSSEEILHLNFWHILGEEHIGSITYSLQQRRSFGPVEQVLTQKNGEKLSIVLYGIAIGESQQHEGIERVWSVMEDVTERKRATDALLRYQLNPHFMFNVLNSVNALMGENQRNAKRMIIQFSSLLRHTLIASTRQTAPLGDEIEAVEHYLTIEKIRFEERLESDIHADRATLRLNVPVFLVQPLVENAIKYGMQTSTKALAIKVSCRIIGEELCIEVANTGAWVESAEHVVARRELHGEISTNASISTNTSNGQAPGAVASDIVAVKGRSTGIGLANLRKRLEQYYPQSYSMTIVEEQEIVRVCIAIALKELSETKQ